jgi:DinB superfamily
MTEIERMLNQYELVLHGDAWHGDAIWKILDNTSTECAAHRLTECHTIWEIVMHMTFWEEVATRRLRGERAGLDEALNFRTMPSIREANWRKTLLHFRASNEEFGKALSNLDSANLDGMSAAGKRSFYDEAHGLIQHNVYHAGQIALLKKDFASKRASSGL